MARGSRRFKEKAAGLRPFEAQGEPALQGRDKTIQKLSSEAKAQLSDLLTWGLKPPRPKYEERFLPPRPGAQKTGARKSRVASLEMTGAF
jgi:hypothetical protein